MDGFVAGRRADFHGTDPASHGARSFGLRTLRAIGVLPAIVLLLCASLLMALEAPSKPFLDKNSFLMSSAGFRIQVANDTAGRKAMNALPPHRFVLHKTGNDIHYLYAEPKQCVCIFIGTEAAYNSYRIMLSREADQPSGVSADYKTQAGALLSGPPTSFYSLNENQTLADYLRKYY